jgi:hypothetical protein
MMPNTQKVAAAPCREDMANLIGQPRARSKFFSWKQQNLFQETTEPSLGNQKLGDCSWGRGLERSTTALKAQGRGDPTPLERSTTALKAQGRGDPTP